MKAVITIVILRNEDRPVSVIVSIGTKQLFDMEVESISLSNIRNIILSAVTAALEEASI